MEASLSHAGDRVGIINSCEADHGLRVVKGDRAVIESNGKDIAIFSMINGYHKTLEVDVSLPSELDFRLTDLSVYMPYDW
jgi:hypothetical protein